MSRRQKLGILAKAMPYVKTAKQRLGLFAAVLIISLTPMDFDSVHLHVESQPTVPTVTQTLSASGNVSAGVVSYSWPGNEQSG